MDNQSQKKSIWKSIKTYVVIICVALGTTGIIYGVANPWNGSLGTLLVLAGTLGATLLLVWESLESNRRTRAQIQPFLTPEIRFRLNQQPQGDKDAILTFVEVENKTATDSGVWVDLRPTVAGRSLGDQYSNNHYNGKRMWLVKRYETIQGTRFEGAHILQDADVTAEEAISMWHEAESPAERRSILSLAVHVNYAQAITTEEGIKIHPEARGAVLPTYYHFNFEKWHWVLDVSPPDESIVEIIEV
ncbi:hypothetical protein ACFL3X_01745 [Gemmatimonadota bacterium]